MNRAWKLLSILSLVPLLTTSGVMAADPEFGAFVPSLASRNIPAGTVVDPGSQLLYIVDTGINVSAAVKSGQFTEADVKAKNVNGLLGITGASGEVQTNFISITNTHPTKAVTIHFRYFNDECEDVLDFLAILTCNDTLLINPFDYEIPSASLGGSAINTKSRIFGPDLSTSFPAIKGDKFASGRFLIFATTAATVNLGANGYPNQTISAVFANDNKLTTAAAVASYDSYGSPGNILFPFELGVALNAECNIDSVGTTFRAAHDGAGVKRNVGSVGGLSANNLHVFNSSAANFNYLIGHKSVAVPKGFIAGAQSDQDQFLAMGVNAWTRPAVVGNLGSTSDFTGFRNGDGPPLGTLNIPDYVLVHGSEILARASDTTTLLTALSRSPNPYYLRQEAHGGDTVRAVAAEGGGATANGPRVATTGAAASLNAGPNAATWTSEALTTTVDIGDQPGTAGTANGPRVASTGVASEIGGPLAANWSTDADTTTVDSGDQPGTAAGVGVGGSSFYGALAWISLHTTDPENQIVHLLSFVDDYDGSKNTAVAATVSGVNIYDRSYNLTGAQTRYILQIYDNNENKLDITTTTPINISPPPTIAATANLRIIVDCLKVWINGVIDPTTERDGLTIQDLYDITALVKTGSGDFAGLAATVNPLTDASQGWVRFVADNRQTRSRAFGTRTVTVTGATISPIDHIVMDNLSHPTFVRIGEINTRFEGFGAAWWAATAAQNPAISNAALIDPSP